MIDQEAIYLIRDTMLEDPNLDAEIIYSIANLAAENFDTYYLMCSWMKEVNPDIKNKYFKNLIDNVNFYEGIEKDVTREFSC